MQDIDLLCLQDFIPRLTNADKAHFSLLFGLFFIEITLLESASKIFAIGFCEKRFTTKTLLDSAKFLYSDLLNNPICFIEAYSQVTDTIVKEQKEKLIQTVKITEQINQTLKQAELLKIRLMSGIPFLVMAFLFKEEGAENLLKRLLPEALLHCVHIKLILGIFFPDETSLEEIDRLSQRLEQIIPEFPFAATFLSEQLSKDNLNC